MKSKRQQASVIALLLIALSACSNGSGPSAPGAVVLEEPDANEPMPPTQGNSSAPGDTLTPDLANPDNPDAQPAETEKPDSESGMGSSDIDSPTDPQRPVVTPAAVNALEDGGALLNDFPSLLFVDTLANSGLQIGYTGVGQQARTDTAFIEEQWDYMQRCLDETGVPPLIVLVEGSVDPLTRDDDVLRFIDGVEIATASVSLSGTVIQISEGDFDGSLGVPGFNLRQIIGRSLWSAAGLPERDYPTTCARVISLD